VTGEAPPLLLYGDNQKVASARKRGS
ncbi:MAG: hypothetical protein RIR28_726, partial [Pseudomonadota bacterium]